MADARPPQREAVTNGVTNLSGDGPDTPAGVRERIARSGDAAACRLADRLDDATIELAIRRARELGREWRDTPAGGVLRLSWPLERGAPRICRREPI